MKPFRFITSKECARLEEEWKQYVDSWNLLYALSLIKCKVMPVSPPISWEQGYLLTSYEGEPLAWLEKEYSSFFQWSLFKEVHPVYAPFSEKLAFVLFAKLFAQKVEYILQKGQEKDWFYPGSPCLWVRFFVAQQTLSLYLHPSWVIKKMGWHTDSSLPIASIHIALAKAIFPLDIVIPGVSLPAKSLLQLQQGDVITTDHHSKAPVLLQGKIPYLWGYLGKSQEYKSITLAGEYHEK
jgi:hypothetical protein